LLVFFTLIVYEIRRQIWVGIRYLFISISITQRNRKRYASSTSIFGYSFFWQRTRERVYQKKRNRSCLYFKQTLEKRHLFHQPPPPPTLITSTSCSLYAVHVDCSHHRVNIDQVNRREEEEWTLEKKDFFIFIEHVLFSISAHVSFPTWRCSRAYEKKHRRHFVDYPLKLLFIFKQIEFI